MRAYAGIGCHYMAQWMDRSTSGFTQMGGEGATGSARRRSPSAATCFRTSATHLQSLGYMAIRRRDRVGRHITYKILYNDAVAMTGGQKNDGASTCRWSRARWRPKAPSASSSSPTSRGKYAKNEDWPRGSPSTTATS